MPTSTAFIRKLLSGGIIIEKGTDYEVSSAFVDKWKELLPDTKLIHLQQALKSLVREDKVVLDLTEQEYIESSVFLLPFFEFDEPTVELQSRIAQLEEKLKAVTKESRDLKEKRTNSTLEVD